MYKRKEKSHLKHERAARSRHVYHDSSSPRSVIRLVLYKSHKVPATV